MARHKEFKKEADLAAVIVAWLKAEGWEVYQEVAAPSGRHDIVATRGDQVWVVECKQAFNIQVMQQAWDARDYAHAILVAVPMTWDPGSFRTTLCIKMGIGLIEGSSGGRVRVVVSPEARRAPKVDKLRARLCEEQKDFAAAGTSGTYWTPFKGFARKVTEFVSKRPRGITVKEASVQKELEYYSSPASFRRNIPPLCQRGVIPGVRCINIGGAWTLLPCKVGEEKDG